MTAQPCGPRISGPEGAYEQIVDWLNVINVAENA